MCNYIYFCRHFLTFYFLCFITLNDNTLHSQDIQKPAVFSDTSIMVSGTRVDLLFPTHEMGGTILVLPGWNFMCNDICIKSDFCQEAKNMGFALIMPDMLKSIYASRLYPETRKDWLSYPTFTWLTDTLIPLIGKRYQLLQQGQKNYVMGISTGGRGAIMVALYTEGIFLAGAGLSGDYNQLELLNDNLVNGYYGSYEQFPDRWSGKDNPQMNASKLKIPLYLAHGKADKIVPYTQTTEFFKTITTLNSGLGHILSLNDTAGHTYPFWQSEFKNVFRFFKNVNAAKQK